MISARSINVFVICLKLILIKTKEVLFFLRRCDPFRLVVKQEGNGLLLLCFGNLILLLMVNLMQHFPKAQKLGNLVFYLTDNFLTNLARLLGLVLRKLGIR